MLRHKKAVSPVDIILISWRTNVLPDGEPATRTQFAAATQTQCKTVLGWQDLINLPIIWNCASGGPYRFVCEVFIFFMFLESFTTCTWCEVVWQYLSHWYGKIRHNLFFSSSSYVKTTRMLQQSTEKASAENGRERLWVNLRVKKHCHSRYPVPPHTPDPAEQLRGKVPYKLVVNVTKRIYRKRSDREWIFKLNFSPLTWPWLSEFWVVFQKA